jgi:Recombinase
VGRRVEECKSELAVIDKMNRLREQEFSYWKIAEVLNSMGVPTKTRKGPWQARSVQQILDRMQTVDLAGIRETSASQTEPHVDRRSQR